MSKYETPEPIAVAVKLSVGDVQIAASDRTDTVVEVRPSDETNESDVQAAQQVRVGYASGLLRVTGPKARAFDFSRKTRSVNVTIKLPSGSEVSADLQMGNFRSSGQAGSTEVFTRSGQVQIGGVEGAVVVKNSNGDTTIDAATGDVHVRAANGNIDVERAGAGVDAKTSNGRIRLGEVARGAVVLHTATGDLDIGIAEGTAARLEMSTGFGRVRNKLEDAAQPDEPSQTVAVRGRTAHGDIFIHRA
jgi:DUF4097 and DUF4098 domain-containing protein YvlB